MKTVRPIRDGARSSDRRMSGSLTRQLPLLLLIAVFLSACAIRSAAPAAAIETPRYQAEIIRTAFGIPHVTAADFGSLGYGIGYAYAQDNFCMFAEKINQLNGERSRYFGPDAPVHTGVHQMVSSRNSDFFYKSQFAKEQLAAEYRRGSIEARELTEGYAAGLNRYLRETGLDNLPQPCRGAAWVRPITDEDLYLWYTSVATLAASQPMLDAIVAAQPLVEAVSVESPPDADSSSAGRFDTTGAPAGIGSNGWAFGREATVNGRGLLLGNPHWPWGNMNQLYEAHLTIPGRLDVMGATYGGMPAVVIGFNRSVAWSHTVSTGPRFVLRELTLAEDSPTTYIVDGERHEMETRTVSIDVLTPEGDVRPESRTFYTTRYGPMLVRDGMPWSGTAGYAITDLNLPNRRLMEQWLRIGTAHDVTEIRTALTTVMGIPWVNTLAVDSRGGTLYADVSVKPYITDEMFTSCGGSETARRATQSGAPTLDGARSECDPLSDPAAPQPGILPPRLLPVLERADYVANSNNSYWLTNPREPITGLPSVNGPAEAFIGFRPQSGLRLIEGRLAGRDQLPGSRFDADAIKALVFGHPLYPGLGNQNRAAEVLRDGLVRSCRESPDVEMPDGTTVRLVEACEALSQWDLRHATDSAGAHLFRETWGAAARIPQLWAIPFDPANPLDTPRDPDIANPQVSAALRQALGGAVAKLTTLGIPLDRRWGELHGHRVGDHWVPLRGNNSEVLNMMVAPTLTAEGYGPRIVHGTSYVQIVGFDEDGPIADAVLLFGQSSNPASPHYYDQLQRLWAGQEWHRMPFDRAEVEAKAENRLMLRE